MENIIKQIEQADELLLNDIIMAATRRYNALRTDRIAGFLSLSADPQTRDAELEDMVSFIRLHCNQQK